MSTMTTFGPHQDSHFLHDHQPLFDWGQPTSVDNIKIHMSTMTTNIISNTLSISFVRLAPFMKTKLLVNYSQNSCFPPAEQSVISSNFACKKFYFSSIFFLPQIIISAENQTEFFDQLFLCTYLPFSVLKGTPVFRYNRCCSMKLFTYDSLI